MLPLSPAPLTHSKVEEIRPSSGRKIWGRCVHWPYALERNLRTKIRNCVPTQNNRETKPGSSSDSAKWNVLRKRMRASLSRYSRTSVFVLVVCCLRLSTLSAYAARISSITWCTARFLCVMHAEICVIANPGRFSYRCVGFQSLLALCVVQWSSGAECLIVTLHETLYEVLNWNATAFN